LTNDRRTARVGLFGGTFDPPHNAHVALARTACDELALDEVRWIPAGAPWQKTRQITPARHRSAMVVHAIEGEARFRLDRREVERKGPSFTLDTVRELDDEFPGTAWFLIIGQDQYHGLPTWRDWRELLGRVTLAVAERPGSWAEPPEALRAMAHRKVGLPVMDISSTDIRARCARGEDISSLVPPAVARYIAQHHLYQEPTGT
jgi:nicotinate-nucleotide adenylyltransferase